MEKKSFGAFLAALRKANGMTQKDLAEKLNVSDKTVSRWEREEGLPDLSLIPVIAEIFEVSCDELLRGERRAPQERTEENGEAGSSAKGEKQRKRLLALGLYKYRARSFVAIGLAVLGLLAAMVCNFGFLRAYIGFFLGSAFYLAALLCQAISINSAFLSVEGEGMEEKEVGRFRCALVWQGEWSIGLALTLFGFTLPLLLLPGGSYVGLSAGYWLAYGALCSAPFLLAVLAGSYFLNASLLKKGICFLPEKESGRYEHNHRLKAQCTKGLLMTLALTLLLHVFGGEMLWSTNQLADGHTFRDYESFVAYMEQDIPDDSQLAEAQIGSTIWYDEQGNEVSEEDARTRTLEDANGNVVCTYVHRNEQASHIRYTSKGDSILPITVITTEDYREARNLSERITMAYCLLYPLEFLAAFILYVRKRA